MRNQLKEQNSTYKKLIQGALVLASEGGIRKITAGKLASKAGVGKSTVFHYFEKTDIIKERLFEELVAYQMDLFITKEYETVNELFKMIESLIFSIDQEGEKYRRVFLSFYNESIYDKEIRKALNEFLEKSVAQVTDKLCKCRDNVKSKEETQIIVKLLITFLDGIGLHILSMDKIEDYRNIWEMERRFLYDQLIKE